MKRDKSAGLVGISIEIEGRRGRGREGASQDWQDASVVPLNKAKGEKFESGSYKGISLLGVVGKMYLRIFIEEDRIRWIDCRDTGGCKEGKGCINQIFIIRMIEEKSKDKRYVLLYEDDVVLLAKT